MAGKSTPAEQTASAPAQNDSWKDTIRNHAEKGRKEQKNILRGLTMAYLEQVRLGSNLVANFAKNVSEGNKAEQADSPLEYVKLTTKSVANGLSKAVGEYIDIPGKTIDKFYQTYKEKESA